MAEYYDWIKAVHIISVVILIGGMLMNGFLFRNVTGETPQGQTILNAAVTFNRAFVGSALGLVWIAGLLMVWLAKLHTAEWFQIKFVIVLILSGIHGAQTGRLSKMRNTPETLVPAFFKNSGLITLVLAAIAICLVAVKPF